MKQKKQKEEPQWLKLEKRLALSRRLLEKSGAIFHPFVIPSSLRWY